MFRPVSLALRRAGGPLAKDEGQGDHAELLVLLPTTHFDRSRPQSGVWVHFICIKQPKALLKRREGGRRHTPQTLSGQCRGAALPSCFSSVPAGPERPLAASLKLRQSLLPPQKGTAAGAGHQRARSTAENINSLVQGRTEGSIWMGGLNGTLWNSLPWLELAAGSSKGVKAEPGLWSPSSRVRLVIERLLTGGLRGQQSTQAARSPSAHLRAGSPGRFRFPARPKWRRTIAAGEVRAQSRESAQFDRAVRGITQRGGSDPSAQKLPVAFYRRDSAPKPPGGVWPVSKSKMGHGEGPLILRGQSGLGKGGRENRCVTAQARESTGACSFLKQCSARAPVYRGACDTVVPLPGCVCSLVCTARELETAGWNKDRILWGCGTQQWRVGFAQAQSSNADKPASMTCCKAPGIPHFWQAVDTRCSAALLQHCTAAVTVTSSGGGGAAQECRANPSLNIQARHTFEH
ncbi:hypothetical protein SKAU_G00313890 [Synaphobranchus kaupii]|uniref:Uncharacterized protein n=1 Tax=Synaphobranchus kaupii TaxID=118154 RepID=A0A9Q1ES76_SYNKA|nr:hypothetical protein SKAU_G00313890 [Synaphobranchus kaupii]